METSTTRGLQLIVKDDGSMNDLHSLDATHSLVHCFIVIITNPRLSACVCPNLIVLMGSIISSLVSRTLKFVNIVTCVLVYETHDSSIIPNAMHIIHWMQHLNCLAHV